METTEIVFAPAARRDIKKLSMNGQHQVISTLEELKSSGVCCQGEKLRSRPDFYRVRAGREYRIIYHVLNKRIIVLVVRNRKNAYKGLDKLDKKLASAVNKIAQEAERKVVGMGR